MNIAVIFAGGVGKRMKSKDLPKQFLRLHGKEIIIYTLELFDSHPLIDAIVVSCVEGWEDYLWNLIRKHNLTKVINIVRGGETGQLSIYNGLCEAEKISKSDNDIVLIHDGVRPLINEKTITDNINSVLENGSCITTSRMTETLLIVEDNNKIIDVPSRANSRIAKAPQSFKIGEILNAHRQALDIGITNFIDSCTMMSYFGASLYLVDGPDENIKVTTPEDFYTMRALLDFREDKQIYNEQ